MGITSQYPVMKVMEFNSTEGNIDKKNLWTLLVIEAKFLTKSAKSASDKTGACGQICIFSKWRDLIEAETVCKIFETKWTRDRFS